MGGRKHNKKRETKDTIQGNWAMAVVGGGDAVGKKHNNQIESMTAAVETVGAIRTVERQGRRGR